MIVYASPSENGFIVDLVWSPDNEKLAFTMAKEITQDLASRVPKLFTINVDGTALRSITNKAQYVVSPNFSPDGNSILYVDWSTPRAGRFLQVVDLEGRCHRLRLNLSGIRRVTLSPGGNKIAIVTINGLLLADTKLALGDDFWTAGTPCHP
jgi:Tol biopolymer transport system component